MASAALAAPAAAKRGPDPFMVGARAQAMAGAVVASTHDVNGQYHNPAVFGFTGRHVSNYPEHTRTDMLSHGRTDFSNNTHVGAGYRLAGGFGEYFGSISDFDTSLLDDGITTEEGAQSFLRLANGLGGIDGNGTGAVLDANLGLGLHWQHTAQGPRGYFQGTGYVGDVDTSSGLGFTNDINTVSSNLDSQVSSDNNVKVLTSDQVTRLENAGTGYTTGSIQDLDYLIRQENLSSDQVNNLVDILETVGQQSGGGASDTDLNSNTTNLVLRGFTLASYPLTFGHAWDRPFPGSTWFGEGSSWAIGGNIVPMQGTVYANQIFLFDSEAGDFVSETVQNGERTNTVGVDLGVMGRYEGWQVGLVGRNLNSPTFKGPTVDGQKYSDVALEPQVRAGAAWFPVRSVTLELDLDLLPNNTLLPNYNTQYAALGFEWRTSRETDIRLGTYRNLIDDSIGPVYTLGAGMGFLGGRLNLAVAWSGKHDDYPGAELKLFGQRLAKDQVPREMRFNLDYSVKF